VNLDWYRNEGNEGFFTRRPIITNNDIAWTVRGNDLDSNGDADLVAMMGNGNGTSNIKVYRNNGAGVFSSPLNLSTPTNGTESETYLHLADINTDGAMDILAYRDNSNNIVWYQNNGALIFTEKIISNKPENQTLSSADVDGDGDIDILSVGTSSILELAWYENDGNENFITHPVTVTNTKGVRLDHVKATDVDGDLDMDLVSAAYWFENDGLENFTQHPINEGMNTGLKAASYGDLDNDGDMDLISTGTGYNWHENVSFMKVTAISPNNAGFSVAANTNISITFDQLINQATLSTKSIVVTSKWRGVIPGTYSGGGTNTITFNPTTDFLPGEDIEVAVTKRVRSNAGHALEINYGIDFKVKVSVAGAPTFSASQVTTHTTAPTGMDIADMDGDGDIDAVSCSSTELLLHINDGLGNFITTAIPITVAPKTVHATDFNKDGKMDIMVNANLTYIYLNDGNQNFIETLLSVQGGTLNMHGLGDVDRDGDTDIIYSNRWSDRTCDFFNSGSTVTTGTGRTEKIADLDGDGDIDFMKSTTISVLNLNNGYLNWTALNIDVSTVSADLADFDGDGDFDIVSSLTNSTLAWYDNNLNTVSKNFGVRKPFGTSLNHSWVAAADLDGDGDTDVAAVSASAGRVVWHKNQLNEASNNFSAAQFLPNSGSPIIVRIADLNGDGTMDLVVLSNTNNQLNWFANSSFPLPTITSFSPASGVVGTTVTINGTNFSATPANNTVNFNGVLANVTVSTTTSITTTVPLAATTGKITVTVAGNTATSASDFTVTTTSLPTIISFTPAAGITGATVTITGTNFSTTPANNTVKFNGTTAIVTASTVTSITTTVPAGATTGTITVAVAGNTATSATNFTVTTPVLPTITSFTPASGSIGTTVTITGTNFSTTPANNTLQFNGTTASVTASTATIITTTVPVGATTGKITVTVAGNSAISANDFTVNTNPTNQPPLIASNTSSAPINGIVTIDLLPLLSDPDDNLDLSTLSLNDNVSEQGAAASITAAFELVLDYGSVAFAGTDRISLSVCDLAGECDQQNLSIEVQGDVSIYNAISPNGDDLNKIFYIEYIDSLPETQKNKVTIYNRWGSQVFEVKDYNNTTKVFSGLNNSGNELPSGTYYYKIEFNNGKPNKTGYLALQR